jgi:HEAT repeat protein
MIIGSALLALLALSATFPAQETDRLSRTIASGTVEEKRTALFEIRNLRSAEASRAAFPALGDTDAAVRATAAFSVVYAPRDEAFAALLPNLSDRSDLVRRETAYALGIIRDPRAVDPLFELYGRDKYLEVRNACLVAVGEIGDVSAVTRLARILERKPASKASFERRSAARSIGRIARIIQADADGAVTPESFLPEKYKTLPARSPENLSESHPPFRYALPLLVRMLSDRRESADARREAAFAIGAIADPETVGVLRSAAAGPDPYLAEICREALLRMGAEK